MNNYKILLAIDSFKGTLSSKECSQIVKKTIKSISPESEIHAIPIADGGEGTVEAFLETLGGSVIKVSVHDPLGRKIEAKYGIFDDGKTAIVEMAEASGINLLKTEELNPLLTSTYGTGELILDAIKKGVKKILIGIGGSATNDGGIGMAAAIGVKFLNNEHKTLKPCGATLSDIDLIDITAINPILNDVSFTILSDVKNPLLGKNGASQIYGPQKGATKKQIFELENGLGNLSRTIKENFEKDIKNVPGAGAAGGLGYGLMVFLDAGIENGINFIIDSLDIEEKIKYCDLVITGEGKMDMQTSFNKVPWGIMKLAKKHNKKVIGIAGLIEETDIKFLSKQFDHLYSVVGDDTSITQSLNNPKYYLEKLVKKMCNEIL